MKKLILLLLFIPLVSFGQIKKYDLSDDAVFEKLNLDRFNYSSVTYNGKEINEGIIDWGDGYIIINFKSGADSHYVKCVVDGKLKFEGAVYAIGDIQIDSPAAECWDCEYDSEIYGLYVLYDKAYDENGNLYMKGKHKNGEYTYYEKKIYNHEFSLDPYFAGMIEGHNYENYDNGILEEKLINGVISTYEYSDSGKLKIHKSVKKGGSINKATEEYPVYVKKYFDNGKLLEEGFIIGLENYDEIKTGTWKFYRENGEVVKQRYDGNGRNINQDYIDLLMLIDENKNK